MEQIDFFPRLSPFVAKSLWEDIVELDSQGEEPKYHLTHPAAHYTATGGQRVSRTHLKKIREGIVSIAERSGFPERKADATRFDMECARYLVDDAGIPFPEACRRDVWPFFTLVLLPDVTKWRFPVTTRERWLRGIRNTFGMLWRRGYLLGKDLPETGSGWEYLNRLTQDALVAIVERSSFTANPVMARAIAKVWIEHADELGQHAMESLNRGAIVNMVAYRGVVDMDSLEFGSIVEWARRSFREAAQSEHATR